MQPTVTQYHPRFTVASSSWLINFNPPSSCVVPIEKPQNATNSRSRQLLLFLVFPKQAAQAHTMLNTQKQYAAQLHFSPSLRSPRIANVGAINTSHK
ncbi:hypothetical protein TrLO_g3602 [Triparma laevis f. longispina]|uniref:Uncharacterized protein n=1 Tax=Triparma laevis f. longispina TaxID=1714387 RepID=A0A9W7AUR9_9STRA|nr:hypothetical protein TrLO_g3602 [Triparma laevis f. longispina]